MQSSDFQDITVTLFQGDETGGDTHTITVDETYYGDSLAPVLNRALSVGWEIVSVIVHATYGAEELIKAGSNATVDAITELLDYVVNEPYRFDAAVGFCVENGLGEFSYQVMEDRFYTTVDSEEDFAKEWWDNNRPQEFKGDRSHFGGTTYASSGELVSMELPEWLVIDWQATADTLAGDGFEYIHYAGSVHVFSS